jgi:ketosteroid isomerase-like protein
MTLDQGAAAAVAAAIDDMYAAFVAGDRDRFDRHLHPAVTAWESHLPGPPLTRAELDAYRDRRDRAGRRPALDRLAATDKRVDVWGEVAVARYVLEAAPPGGPVQRTRVTDVLRHTRGRWLIAHHHAELLREPAP